MPSHGSRDSQRLSGAATLYVQMKKTLPALLSFACLLMASCSVPTPASESWETEAQFHYHSIYHKDNYVYLPGNLDERKKKQLVIRIDTTTGEYEAIEGKFGKEIREIYSEESGYTRIPRVQRANFIDFEKVEDTKGEITPAVSFERMPNPDWIKRDFSEYERFISLDMLPKKDTVYARIETA